MFQRLRLTYLLPFTLLLLAPLTAPAAPASGSSTDEDEAKRLYERARDYVTNVQEGPYSYAYIQFYWKRSQSNIERIRRVYPTTTTGKAVVAGQLKLGEFDLPYFKDRVLYRLQDKVLAAFDPVNCAIFLYNLDEKRWDDQRRGALVRILEVLSRQQRWNEALKFPVLEADRPLKIATIFRVAARFEEEPVVKQLLGITPKIDVPAMLAIRGEALALRGRPRTEIAKLLDQTPEEVVKLGVLGGMIQREVAIQRAAALRILTKNIYLAGGSLQRPQVRDDIEKVAQTFFPVPTKGSAELLAGFHAALGQAPSSTAAASVHLAYLEYLAVFEKFDELDVYARQSSLAKATRQACELKIVELFAQAGRAADAERHCSAVVATDNTLGETAALAVFRGAMNSTEVPLTVRAPTFAALPLNDPCMLAQAIMEWSLTPNRSLRGASPWDPVVQKFQPGFANIPAPRSNAVRDAASSSKPY